MADPSRELGTADVGVLFVHGIGEQQRADTLVQFGEALKGWLEQWLVDMDVKVTISTADLNQTGTEVPAHARLNISGQRINSTWLLAESWWAASFQAPRYGDLWRWSIEVVPLAVADHFVRRFRLARSRSRQLAELALAGVAIALLPFMTLIMMASLVIGILPIPRLRTAILRLQKILLGTVGDSYTLLESSIRGAAMSSRVQHDLRWLHTSVARSVVVAHSQGAAVAHAALQPANAVKPDLFFTFGSGLRKLLVLDSVRGGNRLLIWLLSLGLLLVSVGSWRVYRLIVDPTSRISWYEVQGVDPTNSYGIDFTNLMGADLTDWRWLTGLGVAGGIILGLVTGGGSIASRLRAASFSAVAGAAVGAFVEPFTASGPPGAIAFMLVFGGVMMFVLGLVALVEKDSDQKIDERLKLRANVTWLDRYARADPVPNGPLLSTPAPFVTSLPVWNLGSPILDHSAYWRNKDQFVPAVACAIAEVAGLDLKVERWDTERLAWAEAKRKWRVGWLAVSRVLAVVVATSLLVRFREGLWRTPADLPEPLRTLFGELIELVDDVPFLRLVSGERTQSAVSQALWLASVLLTVWVVYKLFEVVWAWWDRADTGLLFRRADYTLVSLPFAALVAVLSSAVTISLALAWFLDRDFLQLVARDASVQAILENGWKGLYNPSPGLYTASLVTIGASGGVGWLVKFARDWWLWARVPSDADGWRGGFGYALLSFPVIAPASWWIAGTGDSQPVSQAKFLLMAAIVALPGLLVVVAWCFALRTRAGQWLEHILRDVSASGPFGCWLTRAHTVLPLATVNRPYRYALDMLEEVRSHDAPASVDLWSFERERDYSAEATSLAMALAPVAESEARVVLLRLTDRFPRAALSVASAVADRDPSLARRVLIPHAHSTIQSVRRRVRTLNEAIKEPEDLTVSV
jgi:hypothetical protein